MLTIKSFKSGADHNKFNYSHAKLMEIAKTNKWMHDTDQYETISDPFESKLDKGLDKDSHVRPEQHKDLFLSAKNDEIISLKILICIYTLNF